MLQFILYVICIKVILTKGHTTIFLFVSSVLTLHVKHHPIVVVEFPPFLLQPFEEPALTEVVATRRGRPVVVPRRYR